MFTCKNFYLKSNMDRFIGCPADIRSQLDDNLKSNMDRFIGLGGCNSFA